MNGIFGQGMFTVDQNSTPEMLDRKRAALLALMPRYGRAATVGEGIGQLATGIASGVNRGKMDKFEGEKRAEASLQYNGLMAPKRQGPLSILGMREQPSPEQSIADDTMAAIGKPKQQGREEFINAMMPHAIRVSEQTGLDPRLVIAQAAQETGWGKYAPGNNYFGIKSHGKAGGNTFATNEVVDGQTVRINDSFRGYGDMGESADGYAQFLQENPRYGDMLSAGDLDGQLAALGRSGYATDPNYAASVGSIARSIGLPSGYTGGQPAQFTQSGPDINELLMAAQNPWLSREQRATINSQVQQAQRLQAQTQAQQMRQSDPLYQAQLAQAQFDLSQDQAGGGNTTEFGLTPQYITDADGNLSMIQLGKDGTVNQVQLPEGAAIQKGVEKLDLGTGYQWYNTITAQPIGGFIPKDNRGAARATAQGGAEGKATAEGIAAAPSEIAQAQEGIALIDSIINDPALPGITGMVQGRLPPMTQAGTDLNVKVSQLQGKAFLQAFESLKGGGAITEREGRAAQEAMARLDRAQSTEAYVEALDELKGIMQLGLDRARARTGGAQTQEIGQEFTSDTPIPGLSEDDADLWKYSTPEERQAIWGKQ